MREIAKLFGVSKDSLSRHQRRHRGTIVAPSKARQAGASAAARAFVEGALAGQSLVSEVTQLKKRADSLCIQAEVSGDPRTALMAIRELTRLLELQGRLAIEAQAGRAQDVAQHPIFLRFMGKLLQSLASLPGAHEAVTALLERELGVRGYPGGTR